MAKRIIEDIDPTSDLEVSWVRRGANPMAKVFLKKAADQQPETINMALKSVLLATVATTAVGKAFLESLTDEAQIDAFVAKSDDERAAELAAFAKAKNMPMDDGDEDDAKGPKKADTSVAKSTEELIAEAVAKALTDNPEVAALRKANEELNARLEKAVGDTKDTTIRKRAETEFKGLGKSVDEVCVILKALDGLDPVAVGHIEDVFKSHAKLAALVAPGLGMAALAKDASTATAQLNKKAEDLAAAEKIDFHAAFAKVCDDPANAALVEKADEEAQDLAA